tara:strand:+ start:3052 stop:4398 length:1347 start_codon:yes stop_codon:yes gene_type:complete
MDELNITNILDRNEEMKQMESFLNHFNDNKHNTSIRRGMYIYGKPGVGKTEFVKKVLQYLNYDIISFDAGDIRNKTIIDTITKHNMTDRNVMSMFHGQVKRIAIVMDEIDGMNSGDKGGINTLIKLVREKKTKKQKQEEITMNPIICIGNYHIDKKIKELMSVCHTIELKPPTFQQFDEIISKLMPGLETQIKKDLIVFAQGDLRSIQNIFNIYQSDNSILTSSLIRSLFHVKSINEDTKTVTKHLINKYFDISQHNKIINETDRTIVGLLWHENIIDTLKSFQLGKIIPMYIKILKNVCYADYIDRVTFQKQIWQFNEMSSIIKTFYSNKVYHDFFENNKDIQLSSYNPNEVRFTKVLTKYSTEYNNATFIQFLCHQLGMDKRDIQSFFIDMKTTTDIIDDKTMEIFENSDISKLDINRMYRYLDKCIQNSNTSVDENTILVNEIDF